MADTTVKFLHSAMTGAPTLSGTAGTMIAVLDACLKDGFGTGTVDSVVIAGGIATVTRSAGHPMEVGAVALIAGATVSGGSINGEQKVVSVLGNTYTFDATGISNQTATGTITHKLAPLDWTKPYSSTNLATYKPSDVTATGCYLRVDDTGSVNSRVVSYETMSDVNTGTGPFPTSAQISGGGYWPKSSAANGTARPWFLIGDGRMFYLAIAFTNASTSYSLVGVFGDPLCTKSPDAYGCVLNCLSSDQTASQAGNITQEYDHAVTNAVGALYMPRPYTGLGAAVSMCKTYPYYVGNVATYRSGGSSNAIPYPNYADGGLYVVPHNLIEGATSVVRGQSPGLYCTPQNIGPNVFTSRDSVTGVTGLSGRVLKAINSNTGVFFFDTTGPWR